jgi:hypothetical protein
MVSIQKCRVVFDLPAFPLEDHPALAERLCNIAFPYPLLEPFGSFDCKRSSKKVKG